MYRSRIKKLYCRYVSLKANGFMYVCICIVKYISCTFGQDDNGREKLPKLINFRIAEPHSCWNLRCMYQSKSYLSGKTVTTVVIVLWKRCSVEKNICGFYFLFFSAYLSHVSNEQKMMKQRKKLNKSKREHLNMPWIIIWTNKRTKKWTFFWALFLSMSFSDLKKINKTHSSRHRGLLN